ncbi:MAG: helix-turn-helix domain-containing protein [Eubacterium sp.]
MDLQSMIESKNMSKYHLSKISGIPKTTVIDICSGKSSIENCNAKTVLKIARALDCTMEEIMMLDSPSAYSKETGLPNDKKYFECGLPKYLQISLDNMKNSWKIVDSGEDDLHWDLYWCELNADINSAEVDKTISAEQAWYLREKYLRMERN